MDQSNNRPEPNEVPQQWPEDVADWPNTASTVQGGVVSQPARRENAASELVNVHDLIRCAEALERVKGGAE